MTEDGAMAGGGTITEDERSTAGALGERRRSTPAMDVAPELFPVSGEDQHAKPGTAGGDERAEVPR
jgi:hypothetical protein